MLRSASLSLCMMCLSVVVHAQTHTVTWEDFVQYVVAVEDGDDDMLATHLEELEQLHLHPLGINTATHTEMESVPILSPQQVLGIQEYIYRVGQIRSWHELVFIKALDYDTRSWIPLFFVIDTPVANAVKNNEQGHKVDVDLQTGVDIPLYRRAGYDADDDSKRYQGSVIAHRMVARVNVDKKYSFGFNLDKDSGEPVGSPFAMGYDHAGFYVTAKNLWDRCSLYAGDYHLGFGEGVLMNHHFSLGKETQSLARAKGVTAKTGTAETNYLRGVACAVSMGKFNFTAFAAYTLLDANADKLTGMVTSLSTSSTHRNTTEMNHRHITSETMYGGHVEWRGKHAVAGCTAFSSHYHLPFTRGDDAYREFYPEGNTFWGVSLDYGLTLGTVDLRGETATDGHGIATLERLTWRTNSRLQTSVALRYYDPRYHSFHASALSEWGVQNECGAYVLMKAHPVRQLNVSLSADIFHSPHPRYMIDHASDGQEFVINASYDINSRNALAVRAIYHRKEQYNLMHTSQRYRLTWTAKSKTLRMDASGQLSHYSDAKGQRKVGYSFQESVRWQDSDDKVRVALSGAWFDTDDYNSRLYLTEPCLTGHRPFTMLYGEGVRLSATARVRMPWHITLGVRYTFVRYFDRDVIGDGLQQITAPQQNDVSVHVRWRPFKE